MPCVYLCHPSEGEEGMGNHIKDLLQQLKYFKLLVHVTNV